jgi:transposase-like protein
MPPVDRRNPIRARSSESSCSLMEFMREFPDDDACLEWLWRSRFAEDGEHARCQRCEAVRVFKRYATTDRCPAWFCQTCGFRIRPLVGTIFARSSTSLHLWFYAIFLMTSTRCGISAKQLERELGVTYKTAWRMSCPRCQILVFPCKLAGSLNPGQRGPGRRAERHRAVAACSRTRPDARA